MMLKIRIRELRKARGMTIAELADSVGISTPHMSEVERGLKNLNNHLMVRISAALGVDPRDLFEGDASIQAIEIMVSDLSDADRKRVLEFASALRSSQKESE